ncbi:SMI1/KNR4 family protein [Aduncisulcus paluster]|uniref:SMI1/KNR4 family protein n=1 Tax=Aduncisulcus paluster TaxID=2918883 RepID=A0ABQ5KV97_9EUKA|nr:SMI1/KNR4 family protein [Aduncisulcus paluster]
MTSIFADYSFEGFWDESDYALRAYVSAQTPSDKLIKQIEDELGYKFPASYIEFMKLHNGGTPHYNCIYLEDEEYPLQITGFFCLGDESKTYSLVRSHNRMVIGWEYPATGIYICDSPSAGHDMFMLDYEGCEAGEEPQVVNVDQEGDYEKIVVAQTFEEFIRKLEVDRGDE